MPKDLLNRDNFGLLPEPEGRWGSFGVSMVTNIIIMSLLVLFTAAIHKVEKQKYNETLIFPQEVPPPPKIVVPESEGVCSAATRGGQTHAAQDYDSEDPAAA